MRWLCFLLFASRIAAQVPAQAPVDFARDIQPIFQKRCLVCHGPQMQSGGLRLDRREAAQRVIQPGNAAASRLIRMVSGSDAKVMPPMGQRLDARQIELLKNWIDQGAKWAENASGPHWAYRPIQRPDPPVTQNRDWPSNAIDRFVLARLESERIAPSPPAEGSALLRRVSLDLTGLPPAPLEAAAFLNDNRPDAYERTVDRLLASPHYAEKWARYWLDLSHYADSDGYEKDLVRPFAWRYRQWVIDALNQDMPFDQFTIEQIAGDELPNASVEQKVATGFFRNTLTNREGGVNRAEARFEQLVDRTGTVGTVWLGLTVRCAQCHDHKYDPIKHKDYYQLFAYFNNAEESDIDAPVPGELGPYLQALPDFEKKRASLLAENEIAKLQTEWETNIRAAISTPGKNLDWDFAVTAMRAILDHADKVLDIPEEKRTKRQRKALTDYFVRNSGPALAKDAMVSGKLKELRKKLDALDESLPAFTQAQTLADLPQSVPTHIHLRGDYRQNGAEVQPGTPGFLPGLAASGKLTRLTLARWIVSPENPLTARVAVNRMWQELFGRGLVATSDDFGTQGDKPSHPELLDWLASEFRQRGWSQKQMLKLMVMSSTYRQSSHARPDLETRDPGNVLLARQSRLRLPAELIRDEALAASGLLNPAIGGRSIRPPQPAGVAELGYANSVKWKESSGADRYRRGLYIHYQRTTPYPFLANFDEPDSSLTCTRRRASDTPLQSLNLLNDPVFFEAAQALAWRVQNEVPGSFDDRLNYAFQLCLDRKPNAKEKDRLATYYHNQPDWVGLSRIILNLDEFITRE
ncbi:MAG: PSD1 and planctomycete cytochrome C domain-containing protein [Acidobacteriota bacterium]|nr:PSD1 and planctomycete cytochrome C domain-containing protein [Acidobacteriota bacterium]